MRWFHWTVEQFMEVYNPPNAEVTPTSSMWTRAFSICQCLVNHSSKSLRDWQLFLTGDKNGTCAQPTEAAVLQ